MTDLETSREPLEPQPSPVLPEASSPPEASPPLAPAPGGRVRLALLLAIPIATLVASAIGTAFAPKLLVEWPALLIALDPRPTNLVLTSSTVPVAWYFALGVTRWLLADPFLYVLGRERGPAALAWLEPRSGKTGRWATRLLMRVLDRAALPVVFFASGPLVCLLVGVHRMSPWKFAIANVTGTFAVLATFRFFGGRFAEPIAAFTALVAEYLVPLTIASCVAVALVLAHRWRRRTVGARIASS